MTAVPEDLSDVFFEAAGEGRLLMRRCRACRHWAAPYSLRGIAYRDCPECHEPVLEWEEVGGEATLVTWTVGPDAPAGAEAGFVGVRGVVELREGPWLACAIDVPVERLVVDMDVRLTFAKTATGITIPTARAT